MSNVFCQTIPGSSSLYIVMIAGDIHQNVHFWGLRIQGEWLILIVKILKKFIYSLKGKYKYVAYKAEKIIFYNFI